MELEKENSFFPHGRFPRRNPRIFIWRNSASGENSRSGESSGRISEVITGEIFQRIPKGTPEGISVEVSRGILGDILGGISKDTLKGTPERFLEGIHGGTLKESREQTIKEF